MSRIIKCRFRNLEDLYEFSKRVCIPLNARVHTCYVDYKYTEEKDPKPLLTGLEKYWTPYWNDMYEFNVDYHEDCHTVIDFVFEDIDKFNSKLLSKLFNQNITDKSKYIWYPKLERKPSEYRVLGGEMPIYPIYIVSKGRAVNARWHTSTRLSQANIPHYIVVEPQEVELYQEAFKDTYATILEMDMSYRDNYDCFSDLGNINSTGPGAARNFAWEHSMKLGYKYHWVFDDNVAGFRMFFRGKRIRAYTGEIFRSLERFVDRFDNVLIAGLNYYNFCRQEHNTNAYILNTRIYSMLFIKNDIPYRWRGRYNEDTDLSLRVLKDGYCTLQFNLFMGDKMATQVIQGGNTAEFYAQEGTNPKSQMLYDMHPDVTTLTMKYGRPHHEVNYKVFKNKLNYASTQLDENYVVPDIRVYKIPEDWVNTEKDNRTYLENHLEDLIRVDNTSIFLE